MKKKISIITVVKNGMPFLKSAIMSFNLQSYKNKELIIVYASSNDGTEEYLHNLNSSNIFIKKDLNSITKFGSINLGINIASGDMIGLLHSDDVFYNENILDDISYNFNNDIDLLYGDVLFSKNNNLSKITRIWKSNKFKKSSLKFGWMPPHTSIFIRKNFINDTQCFYDENYPISGDYDFILKILCKPNIKTFYLRKYISIMRSGGDSTKLSNSIKKYKEDLNIARKYFKFNYFCIFFKIIQKISQFKIFIKKVSNNYINDLNQID